MMRLSKSTMLVLFSVMTVLAMATTAHAVPDFITGLGWVSTETIAAGAPGGSPLSLALATCSHGTAACTAANADVKITTTGIGFSFATATSISLWLATNTFANTIVFDTAAASPMDPTIWHFFGNAKFTGTVATPQSFTFSHDDGLTFIVNGQTVVDAPGQTSPTTTTGSYTGGAGGSLPFDLYYAECCGGPAELKTTLVGPENPPVTTPEPATLLLLGLGLGVAGLGFRRRRKLS